MDNIQGIAEQILLYPGGYYAQPKYTATSIRDISQKTRIDGPQLAGSGPENLAAYGVGSPILPVRTRKTSEKKEQRYQYSEKEEGIRAHFATRCRKLVSGLLRDRMEGAHELDYRMARELWVRSGRGTS